MNDRSSATLYKGRTTYGGMDASLIGEMKAMAEENLRLKCMFADVRMQNDLLTEALGKNHTASAAPGVSLHAATGSRPQANAVKAVAMKDVSIALACRAFDVILTSDRYSPKLDDENEQIADLLPAERVVRALDQITGWRGAPKAIRADNDGGDRGPSRAA